VLERSKVGRHRKPTHPVDRDQDLLSLLHWLEERGFLCCQSAHHHEPDLAHWHSLDIFTQCWSKPWHTINPRSNSYNCPPSPLQTPFCHLVVHHQPLSSSLSYHIPSRRSNPMITGPAQEQQPIGHCAQEAGQEGRLLPVQQRDKHHKDSSLRLQSRLSALCRFVHIFHYIVCLWPPEEICTCSGWIISSGNHISSCAVEADTVTSTDFNAEHRNGRELRSPQRASSTIVHKRRKPSCHRDHRLPLR
jgi:hypothetical protein